MIDKYRLDDLRLESGEKGELARWVIQLQTDLDSERRKVSNTPVIPNGYVMVPKDATLDMLKAGAKQEMKGEAFQYVWQAMLAAAPELPGLEPAATQEVKGE